MEELASLALGILFAWGIITFMPRRSNFTLNPWPLAYDDSNLMLIGVGLASRKPVPSVMDASSTPASVAIMTSKLRGMAPTVAGTLPHMSQTTSQVSRTPASAMQVPMPAPMAPTPVSMSPTPLMTVPSPSS